MLGDRVRALRQQLGFTQEELARYADVNQSYLSQIENGRIKSPGSDILTRLAHRLRTTPNFLLGIPSDQTSTPRTELEWQLLDDFRKFSEEEQRTILGMVQFLERNQHRRNPRIIGDDEGPT